MLDAAILSANGDRSSRHPACRHKKVVTIRTDSSAAMSKASRMKLMAAPKGKKRRVD
ncbi:hypothetical protein DRE_06635 [Drechslerella stenobrocha 248]|uniref:Uncharacterized protein n=1 Tax=Drechslerella stenobrocha 248 TaxID=1043628 RepID=W7HKW9_9PEZI|nr:hypothetical protein DRE_06635 [Drechslerella stenobrocha 248]